MSADMTKHPHWAVTVEASGEKIVRLETECYGGREISDADEVAIRTAAYHLLAFIGDRTFDMIECEAFHAGYEAGERDAGTPHPAPVTAREAEPTSGTEREAFDFARRVYKETGVTPDLRRVYDFYKKARNEPQPSETVAEAAEIERLTKAHDTVCGALAEAISRAEKAEAENQRLREALKKIASTGRCEFAEVRAVLRSTEASND